MASKALHLAKVPLEIIITTEALTKTWTTQAGLQAKNITIETDSIDYQRGILQGDGLSVILFALSINPVSFLLRKVEEYELGETIKLIINHLLFVDDLKLYSRTLDQMKKLLDIITTFTNNIRMIFGEAKCAYIYIVRSKKKCLGSSIQINGLTIQELKEGEQYKLYLGQDESVAYHGPLNKEWVLKEYKKRVRKIWSSELYGNNKATAHNTLAVPLITPTIGILQWTKKEICDIDIATRKILSYTGNLHKRADINRLYVPRKQGGRGLTSVEDIFISRHIILAEHLNEQKLINPFLEKVVEHEQDKIIRLGEEFKQELRLSTTKKASREAIKHKLKQKHLEAWKNKPTHGYIFRKVEADIKKLIHRPPTIGSIQVYHPTWRDMQQHCKSRRYRQKQRSNGIQRSLTSNRNADCVKIRKKPSSTYLVAAHLCHPIYTLPPDMTILQENLYEK